jgi:N-acetylneuraminic acid mutarotase
MSKVRVNITVDKETLLLAKKKLGLFGGKLSTLFDAYLRDFVKSMDKDYGADYKVLQDKMVELEKRLYTVERKKL